MNDALFLAGHSTNFDINEYSKQQALAQEFIEKDLYDEEALAKKVSPYVGIPGLSVLADNVIGDKADENSVLGEKSDALVQSAGQLAATAGLQAAGIPWWATSGATSMGGEVESALKRGATMDEATISGLVTAGAEILTEKISGGIKFGGKTLDDKMTKAIADKISNKVVNAMAQTGVGALGEGGEEVLSGYMSAIGQKLTYMNDKEITEIFSSDEALESFIGGAILGGGATAVNEFSKLPTNKPLNLPETDAISTQTETTASDVANAEEKAQKEAEQGSVDTLANLGYNNNVNANISSSSDGGVINGSSITETNERSGAEVTGVSQGQSQNGVAPGGKMESGRTDGRTNSGLSSEFRITESVNREKLNKSGVTNNEFRETTSNPELFSFALEEGRLSNEHGLMVDPHSADELKTSGAKTFLAKNNTAGGAVMPDGNITAVFKNKRSASKRAGVLNDALFLAGHSTKSTLL